MRLMTEHLSDRVGDLLGLGGPLQECRLAEVGDALGVFNACSRRSPAAMPDRRVSACSDGLPGSAW
jgi:hypothetical protein